MTCPITTKLVLDEDEETKEPLVQVHRNLVTKLKPHQVDGKDKVNSVLKYKQQYYVCKNTEILWTNVDTLVFCFGSRGAVYVGLLL